jgi:hypothetical protein
MSVQNVGAGTALTGLTGANRFFLPGANEFSDTLSIGQIIQGKVLRGFEGNRYLVAFGQDERVVDSAIPLTAGEILHGRVVGLGERVELQRVYTSPQEKKLPLEAAGVPPPTFKPPLAQSAAIDALLQRYRIELTEADRATLLSAARAAEDPEAMGLAGAMLSKLGLPQASVLLEALYRAQLAGPVNKLAGSDTALETLPQVAGNAQLSPALQMSSIRELSQLLAGITDAQSPMGSSAIGGRDTSADVGAGAGAPAQSLQSAIRRSGQQARLESLSDRGIRTKAKDAAQALLADRILNAQTGGVVSHRSGLLPLLVGGKLVEVSFALFEQGQPAARNRDLQHRQVIFSLHTDLLGRVDVVARIAAEHVRVQITTDSEDRTAQTAGHADVLKNELAGSGWHIDEVAYGTRAQSTHNTVVRAVIEHVVSLDSLNRLV